MKEQVYNFLKNKTHIPKPEGGYALITNIGFTKIDGIRKEGFQYSIAGDNNRKYVPFETLFVCHKKLISSKKVTREWFSEQFEFEHRTRPCNFTTIGGILEKLEIAKYDGHGNYILI